jgi:hypothetical protein
MIVAIRTGWKMGRVQGNRTGLALRFSCFISLIILSSTLNCFAQKIDRKAVVSRHNVVIDKIDTLGSLTVGNGRFAFTVDATGLQTFPKYYNNGVPLGTQSEWGWHSFPNKQGYKYSETLKDYNFNNDGNKSYAVQIKTGRGKAAGDYFRENPHRLQLGNIGFELLKKDGSVAKPQDIKNIRQELNLWTGEITSNFTIEDIPVKVITYAGMDKDVIAVKVTSPLIKEHHIKITFRFPYPTNGFADMGTNYSHTASHQTLLNQPSANTALFTHKLDNYSYYAAANWSGNAAISKIEDHYYALSPSGGDTFEASVAFSQTAPANVPAFADVEKSSVAGWEKFWLSGAAIDLAGSTDSRAAELERRIVLSQYLMRVQEAGNFPPQETGLTYNSWYGRPHMEMLWWHSAHYALWGRADLMEKSMQWYFNAYPGAEEIAKRQGYKGIRWQKMTDNEGDETPFLIWQQPNVIYEADLLYRDKPSKQLLQKYSKLVFATADFMASFARYNSVTGRYDLGKGIIPAQESHNSAETFNSPYELAYWKWALGVAQNWRIRLGLAPDKSWQQVIDKIAPLAVKDRLYKSAQDVDDSYSATSKYTTDHPAVLMASSLLPTNGMVDTAIMHKTYEAIDKGWRWEHTWGWDFPMVAMAATRINQPEAAIDALFKDVTTNTYLLNGHNYQTKRLTIYLPGNGSLLAAVALMCAGYDGNKIANPGFPKNGKWKIKWEGFKPLP